MRNQAPRLKGGGIAGARACACMHAHGRQHHKRAVNNQEVTVHGARAPGPAWRDYRFGARGGSDASTSRTLLCARGRMVTPACASRPYSWSLYGA